MSSAKKLGTFSYLPPFSPSQIDAQIAYLIAMDLEPAVEHAEVDRASDRLWHMWRLPMFGERDARAVRSEVESCARAYPDHCIRLVGYDTRRQTRSVSFVARSGDQLGC